MKDEAGPLLVVEDDPDFQAFLADLLESHGYRVLVASDGPTAWELAQKQKLAAVITDQRLPGFDGIELLRRLRSLPAQVPVIVLTAFGTVPQAVEAMRLGALDYLQKPLPSPRTLLFALERALTPQREDETLVAESSAMRQVLDLVHRVAGRDVTVLILGESGTGKELVARTLHRLSPRRSRAFVALNCAALPESLAEAELFGYEKGAFTGADQARAGRFEEADGGTLFLDEVGELPLPVQSKLLRVLETGQVQRLGSGKVRDVSVRLVAATNRNLEEAVKAGSFRADLYYRLAVVTITLPSLRERPEDVEPLARHLLERLAVRHQLPVPDLHPQALRQLQSYSWPGNVRELRNVLERALVVGEGRTITPDLLQLPAVTSKPMPEDEEARLRWALEQTHGNREAAARLLGISVRTLYYKLRKLQTKS